MAETRDEAPAGRHDTELPREVGAPGDALSEALAARTPARILVGTAGGAYRTATQLELRRDHAAALDAVRAEIDLRTDLGADLVARRGIFEVTTRCRDKAEYLMRPDLGRRLSDDARERIRADCPAGADLQVAIGDGLSAAAVVAQAPAVLEALAAGAAATSLGFGRPFFVRYCRVGVLNEIGEILDPRVVVLLIGERPGLRTAESLSAYMAHRPRPGHSDADRNLVCNIHARGVPPGEAATRILALARRMCALGRSGVEVKEELAAAAPPPSLGRA